MNLNFLRCECPDGRFGVTCNEDSSACTTGQHQCEEGAKCSVVRDGSYQCLCPFGKTGKFCKEGISNLIINHIIRLTPIYVKINS